MRKKKQSTPLLSTLTISMLCSSLISAVGAHTVFQKYNTDGWSQPAISVLMQMFADQDYPGNGATSSNAANPSANQPDSDGLPMAYGKQTDSTSPESESNLSGQANGANQNHPASRQPEAEVPEHVSGQSGSANVDNNAPWSESRQSDSGSISQQEGAQPDSELAAQPEGYQPGSDSVAQPEGSQPSSDSVAQPEGSQPGSESAAQPASIKPDSMPQPEAKQYEFTAVTQEYFDDALLIGDSRAEGVALYSGWNNLTYYTEGGMTIYNLFQHKVAEADGQKVTTIEEALQERSFGKIYLEIGINEMGTGTVDSFMETYEAAVTHLRELQPDAILYLCGIMYVKQSKSESDPIFNNPNIQARNDRIAALADGENIFYLDINELVTDETGNLNPDYTWDEVHLLGKYDMLWLDYFCSHGILKE